MTTSQDKALIQRATFSYPEMVRALLSAMRSYHRNDEPGNRATAPAAMPLALACVLAVRMADEPGALELARALFSGGVDMMEGAVLPGAGSDLAADVLRRLEDGGVI